MRCLAIEIAATEAKSADADSRKTSEFRTGAGRFCFHSCGFHRQAWFVELTLTGQSEKLKLSL